jgi:hypothetical protein
VTHGARDWARRPARAHATLRGNRSRRAGRLVVVSVAVLVTGVAIAAVAGPTGRSVPLVESLAAAGDAATRSIATGSTDGRPPRGTHRSRRRNGARASASGRRLRGPRPPDPVTVSGALRRARLTGAIDKRTYRAHRRAERRARAALDRLSGARRAEMAAAVATIDALAARRLLTVERMPAAFLTLRRNLQVWTGGAFPAPGERLTFGRDAAVFQYFAGRGIVFHPLASFGRINALARICLERRLGRTGRERCRTATVRRGLDRLVALAARRGGFTAWEYFVGYGGGTPPGSAEWPRRRRSRPWRAGRRRSVRGAGGESHTPRWGHSSSRRRRASGSRSGAVCATRCTRSPPDCES